jgi:hypothetical protein
MVGGKIMANNFDIATYTRLRFWVQMVLPTVYDDSLSYLELLSKVVKKLNELGDDYNQLVEVLENTSYDYSQMQADIALLQEEMEKVKNGEYVSAYVDALAKWIDENLQELVSRIVTFVSFGLTDNGYFFADVTDHWDFLRFGTIFDMNDPNYLHLYIEY